MSSGIFRDAAKRHYFRTNSALSMILFGEPSVIAQL
jgi:hypothetical protein